MAEQVWPVTFENETFCCKFDWFDKKYLKLTIKLFKKMIASKNWVGTFY
jgi:hypothetical protein